MPGNDPTPQNEPQQDPQPQNEPTPQPSSNDFEARLAEERKKWEKEQKKLLEKAKSEGEKLAKLSAEERFKQEREAFEKERTEFQAATLLQETKAQLSEQGLPSSFAKYLTGSNAEETAANIKEFSEKWKKEQETELNKKLAGKTPKSGGSNGGTGGGLAALIKGIHR